jgi:predicted RNase H-like nuclease (RuvC/YqgF family)
METSWLVISTVTGLFAAGGVSCIVRVIQLYLCERTDILTKELKKRMSDLNGQAQTVRKKIEELEEKRNRLGEACEIDDIEWWVDDNRWRLQDIEWEIRDTKWEIDDRIHQNRTSRATFWAASGATLFALASLVFSVGGALRGC